MAKKKEIAPEHKLPRNLVAKYARLFNKAHVFKPGRGPGSFKRIKIVNTD